MRSWRARPSRAVDLADFALRRTDTLSGGEQRRVAVASLLVQQPAIYPPR